MLTATSILSEMPHLDDLPCNGVEYSENKPEITSLSGRVNTGPCNSISLLFKCVCPCALGLERQEVFEHVVNVQCVCHLDTISLIFPF